MNRLRLSESDYRFMLLIWENEPVPSGMLVALCAEKFDWKKPTTYTVLRRLAQRGILKNEDTVVTALVPRERVEAYASEHFVERAFEGSLPRFLLSFLGGKTLSDREAEELKRLIDEHRKNGED